ncbi:MAG: hypothetical protein Q4A37_01315 [Candidatus Saccharibacteria bacterium]|nr:hypothetical protein [Candidatus Saccharibacteria bacterium]
MRAKEIVPKKQVLKIFIIALIAATAVVAVKYLLHRLGFEPIEQSSMHNSVISSAIFVIGFLLSVAMADYKESERMPAEFAATLEDLYDDAASIHQSYPVFDLDGYRRQLRTIAKSFTEDVRRKSYDAREDIRALLPYFVAMEQGKVPPNFVVKLKQQQAVLLRHRHRVNYIQRIQSLPSATLLGRSIVVVVIGLLLFTNIDPFFASLMVVGLISFVLVYMIVLIRVISKPFHKAGRTMDDVSLFLIRDAEEYLAKVGKKKKA